MEKCVNPIIGILTQETFCIQKHIPHETFNCFLCANYVKYVECAGARVLPIWIGQKREYYEKVVNYTNGLLFPGGATYFTEEGGYGEAGAILYELAVEKNNQGIYYPIWGTCLGFQLLFFAHLNKRDIRTACKAYKLNLPLEFKENYKMSKMFRYASDDFLNNLMTKSITYNYHQFCITEEDFYKNKLDKDWMILSVNEDREGICFVSTVESKNYPFYGVQFHPEKHQFSFVAGKNIPHCIEAIEMGQYFANFFIKETKKNVQRFPSREDEVENLIYNFNVRNMSGIHGTIYDQVYFFTEEDCLSNLLEESVDQN